MQRLKILFLLVVSVMLSLPIMADSEMVGGYIWTYQISGNAVQITRSVSRQSAISPEPSGAVTIPSNLSGKPVTTTSVFSYKLIVKDFTGQLHEYVGHVTVVK